MENEESINDQVTKPKFNVKIEISLSNDKTCNIKLINLDLLDFISPVQFKKLLSELRDQLDLYHKKSWHELKEEIKTHQYQYSEFLNSLPK